MYNETKTGILLGIILISLSLTLTTIITELL